MMLVLYAFASTALWYVGSRALITQALWSRYPKRFARFMDCPACVGFWWGMILSSCDLVLGDPNATRNALAITFLPYPIFIGICMIVMVPLFAGLMQRALLEAGSAIDDVPKDDHDA